MEVRINPAPWFVDWIRGSESDSGVTVNGKTALEFAPVWYAVNKIAGNIAQLPLILHAREGDRGRRRAVEHPSYRLLKKRPNALMTAAVFKETLTAHALLQGNGRAAIVRNLRGDPVELIPLLPDRTETVMVEGEKWHLVRITGQSEPQKLRDRDVLHIPGLGYDGIVGYSLIELARNSWGLGMAAEKTSSHHFRNDAMPGAVINAPSGVLTDEAEAETFLHKFRKWHEGISGASRVGLLRDGMTITPMAVTGRDAQWIEQRLFQRQEVALWFLLEQILGDDSSVSYNSLAEKNLAYLTNCLNRWLVKWEEECDEKLLREREKLTDTHYWKFVTGALFKSDVKTTIEAGAQAIAATILSPNEVREWFELNPREGGDEYQNPNTSSQGSGVGGQGSGSEDQARALLADRLTDLIGVEMKRVQAAARKSGNFVSWLDGFYSDARFMKTLARAVLAAGGEEWQVIEHCDASKQQLLDVAGKATPAELVAKVEAAIGAWPARAEALAGEILSGEG
jgi:HK97 family phage portal protein